MTTAPDTWAPVEILESQALRETIDTLVEAWALAWFETLRLSVSKWEVVRTDVRADIAGHGRTYGEGIGVSCAERAGQRLLERALDAALADEGVTPADQRILDGFITRILVDLSRRLEAGLNVARNAPPANRRSRPSGGVRVGLADKSGPVLVWLAAPLDLALPLCRASLRPARAPAQPLTPRLRALASQPLLLDAVLGATEISLSELRDLACGDVLVLDRPLDAPAAIQLAGSDRLLAHAALDRTQARLRLTLKSLNA